MPIVLSYDEHVPAKRMKANTSKLRSLVQPVFAVRTTAKRSAKLTELPFGIETGEMIEFQTVSKKGCKRKIN